MCSCVKSFYNGYFAGNLTTMDGKGVSVWSKSRTSIALVVGVASLFFMATGICGLVNPNIPGKIFGQQGYNFFAKTLNCGIAIALGVILLTALEVGLNLTHEKEITVVYWK